MSNHIFKIKTLRECKDCGYRVPVTAIQFSPTELQYSRCVCAYCKSTNTVILGLLESAKSNEIKE